MILTKIKVMLGRKKQSHISAVVLMKKVKKHSPISKSLILPYMKKRDSLFS